MEFVWNNACNLWWRRIEEYPWNVTIFVEKVPAFSFVDVV